MGTGSARCEPASHCRPHGSRPGTGLPTGRQRRHPGSTAVPRCKVARGHNVSPVTRGTLVETQLQFAVSKRCYVDGCQWSACRGWAESLTGVVLTLNVCRQRAKVLLAVLYVRHASTDR